MSKPSFSPWTKPGLRASAPLVVVARFDAGERAFLLRQRGIAEVVLEGLEAMGIGSLHALVSVGADELCKRMHYAHGRDVWSNRRRAIRSAIEAVVAAGLTEPRLQPSSPASDRAHTSN